MKRYRVYALSGLTMTGILAVVLVVGLFTSQAASPRALATIDPTSYFPLRVGNQWVYSWTNNIYARIPIIENLVITEETSSLYTIRAQHSGAEGEFRITTTSGYQWHWWHGSQGVNPFPIPMYLIPYYLRVPANLFPASFQVGDSWTGTDSYGGTIYTGTTTVVTDTATVLAGGHIYTNCLYIHTVITGPHSFGAGTRDAWFAPDVGLVKLVYNHNDGSATRAELLMGPHIYATYLPLVARNFDMGPPIVVSTYPPDGSTNVRRDLMTVSVTFNEPMQYSWSLSASGGFPLGPATRVDYDPATYTFTFTRTTTDLLPAQRLITFTVNPPEYGMHFRDLSGNPAPTTMFSFMTSD